MIRVKFPVIIDASVLTHALQIAEKSGSQVLIETFFRLRYDSNYAIDCDTEQEALEMARLSSGTNRADTVTAQATEERVVDSHTAPETRVLSSQ